MESPYERIGRIIHFYPKAGVAIIELVSGARKGDRIIVRGSLTKLQQTIDSMEYEHTQVSVAKPGQSVGVKIIGRARKNDMVYRLKS